MNDDVVDLKEALERVQDDKELLLELFDIFLGDCTKKIEIIRQAIEKKDLNQLKDTAHSLKGASGNISAKKLYNSFLTMEQIKAAIQFAASQVSHKKASLLPLEHSKSQVTLHEIRRRR